MRMLEKRAKQFRKTIAVDSMTAQWKLKTTLLVLFPLVGSFVRLFKMTGFGDRCRNPSQTLLPSVGGQSPADICLSAASTVALQDTWEGPSVDNPSTCSDFHDYPSKATATEHNK